VGIVGHSLLVFAAACAAGAINSVAGGGSLVSFPTLVWLGLPSVTANATNTVSIWPGAIGSTWGYRRELQNIEHRMYLLVAPSLLGGVTGALLLRLTPTDLFDRLVPVLILFATCLFMLQEPIQRLFNRSAREDHRGSRWMAGGILFQLLVGIYGGYFGAGIGILMLAALAIMGHDDIHQMNGFKNLLAGFVNGIAALYFIWMRMVSWPDVGVMATGAILGGALGAGIARRLGQVTVRRIVIAIGFAMAASLFAR
jgi:uncharacterized membrane protein YfcA